MRFILSSTIFCLTLTISYAQRLIPVYEEPLHELIFSNHLVRILDVQALAGDTSQLHVHNENYCYVALRGGSLWLDEAAGIRQVEMPDLFVGGIYNDPPQPLIHRFANCSSHPIRIFTVERLSEKPIHTLPLPINPDEEIILDNSFFRVIRIKSSEQKKVIEVALPTAVVSLNGSRIPGAKSKHDWLWMDKGKKLTVIASGNSIDVMCIQIK
ncbi:MAG: hypothetical protein HC811_03705 [Flammeovirgaceae bacterium]|nr:hypothetical protein [Flammeovirgaceae bacterium]